MGQRPYNGFKFSPRGGKGTPGVGHPTAVISAPLALWQKNFVRRLTVLHKRRII